MPVKTTKQPVGIMERKATRKRTRKQKPPDWPWTSLV